MNYAICSQGFNFLKLASERGDCRSQARLASLYMKGTLTEKNPLEAFCWSLKVGQEFDASPFIDPKLSVKNFKDDGFQSRADEIMTDLANLIQRYRGRIERPKSLAESWLSSCNVGVCHIYITLIKAAEATREVLKELRDTLPQRKPGFMTGLQLTLDCRSPFRSGNFSHPFFSYPLYHWITEGSFKNRGLTIGEENVALANKWYQSCRNMSSYFFLPIFKKVVKENSKIQNNTYVLDFNHLLNEENQKTDEVEKYNPLDIEEKKGSFAKRVGSI